MLNFAAMKLLVLAAMLAWGFAPQAAKPVNAGAAAKSAAAHANNPATPTKRTDSAPAQSPTISIVPDDQAASQRAASGASDLEVKMIWFASTLPAVALPQLLAPILQTFSLRKLDNATSSHTHELE